MDVFTHWSVIAGNGDEDIPSLVEGARSGQRAALEGLIARVHERVRGWAARFTDDQDSADDVAQDVLIELERRLRKFDGKSRFSTWLFSVTRNVALTQRRREQRRWRLSERRALLGEALDVAADDPDAVVLGRLVLGYWSALPRRQRQIFELADIRGFTPAEIANDLGMQQVTVRAHLFKARQTIRAQMLEHHERMIEEYRS
jgi:RNA polymerase sigma factor (sigma-70 family)